MGSLRISPRSPYGNFFLNIVSANAKDISKMDPTLELHSERAQSGLLVLCIVLRESELGSLTVYIL